MKMSTKAQSITAIIVISVHILLFGAVFPAVNYDDRELALLSLAVSALLLLPLWYFVRVLIKDWRQRLLTKEVSVRMPESNLSPVSDDPDFSAEAFKQQLLHIWSLAQECRMSRNLDPLRPYLTDAAASRFDAKLQQLQKGRITMRIDKAEVLDVAVRGFRCNTDKELVVVEFYTCGVEYAVSDKNGKKIWGSDAEQFFTYQCLLSRPLDTTLRIIDGEARRVCPNCRAELPQMTRMCPYCDTDLTAPERAWKIEDVWLI